jgi:hypothetical protein
MTKNNLRRPARALLLATSLWAVAAQAGIFDIISKVADKGTQAAAAATAAKYDPNGDPLAQAATLVRRNNVETIKGAKKIVIGQFEVQFMERIEASSTTSNQLNQVGKDDSASAFISLIMKGHERSDFQKITDQLYAKLKTDLIASGYELQALETLASPKDPAAITRFMAATSKTRPLEFDADGGKSVVYAPTDFPLHHIREGMITQQYGTQRSALAREPEDIYTPGVSFSDSLPAFSHLSSMQYVQPANVLYVRYVVAPGSTRGEKNTFGEGSITDSFGQTLSAKAEITPHLVIVNEQTRFVLSVAHNSGGRFSLISPVWSSEPLGVVANTTDSGKKTAETIGNAAMILLSGFNRLGGGSMATKTISSEEFTLVTKPEAYNAQAIKYLEGVQKMFIQSMLQATQ